MGLDHRGIISVVELVIYVPFLLVAILLCVRHGFNRASGWVFTILLCLVRIVGAICQLVTYSSPSTGLYQAVVILDSIGLTPLLLATLGLLSRLVDWINASSPTVLVAMHFRVIQSVTVIGLILGIVGGTTISPNPDGTYDVATTTKVGVILYIVSYVAICFVLLISLFSIRHAPKIERLIAPVVALALPFIAVRLLYSVLTAFVHNKTFSRIGGSLGVKAGMSVIMEFVVIGLYLLLGLKLEKLEPEQRGEISARRGGVIKGLRQQHQHRGQAYQMTNKGNEHGLA